VQRHFVGKWLMGCHFKALKFVVIFFLVETMFGVKVFCDFPNENSTRALYHIHAPAEMN